MSEVKVGLIGCGGMGMNLARHCHSLENAAVKAVFDVSDEAKAKAVQEFDATAYPSHSELIASDIDAVIIAPPNDLHASITIEAANAGKHVFCEKPMALNVADCDAMIQAADRAGVKLMVGQVLRLFPVFWKTRQIVASGDLGSPFGMYVRRLGAPEAWRGTWRTTIKQAGGILYEVNVHEIDFMRHVMGEAKSVYATMGHYTPSSVEYEDAVFVHISFASGGHGVLQCGTSSSLPSYEMIVQCDGGTVTNGGFGGPIRYCRFGEEATEIKSDEIVLDDPYLAEIKSWVGAVTEGAPMVFDARDGRAAIELAQAAYLSAETGDVVQLPLGS